MTILHFPASAPDPSLAHIQLLDLPWWISLSQTDTLSRSLTETYRDYGNTPAEKSFEMELMSLLQQVKAIVRQNYWVAAMTRSGGRPFAKRQMKYMHRE